MRFERWIYVLPLRVRSLFRRQQVEHELDEEVRYHLEQQIAEHVANGMNPKEARLAATRAFGGVLGHKEAARDTRRLNLIDNLFKDLRYAARAFLKNPGFTTVAVLTLALGIGANTAICSVVNSVLLRPLPYENPEELVMVWETELAEGYPTNVVSRGSYLDWRDQNAAFEDMGAYMPDFGVSLTGKGNPIKLSQATMTPSLLDVFGVRPVLGRGFSAEEGVTGRGDVVLLSYGLWQQLFGGDEGVLGDALTIDDSPYTIVGVMPPSFNVPTERTELWIPFTFSPEDRERRGSHMLTVVARMREGVDRSAAQADTDRIAAALTLEYPEVMEGWGTNVVPLHEHVVGRIRPTLLVLFGAVGLILLIACANVSNLLLARSVAREREIAVRAALGAGRWRLTRPLLIEGLLVALSGGVGGLLLAVWGTDLLIAAAPDNLPRLTEVGVDGNVLGFTLAMSVSTALVFGLLPALRGSNPNLTKALKDGGRGTASGRHHRLRRLLVVGEIGVALSVLVGAGLLIRSFEGLRKMDPGLDVDRLLTVSLNVPFTRYPDSSAHNSFYENLNERIRSVPGVEAVAATSEPPLVGYEMTRNFALEVAQERAADEKGSIHYRAVTSDYFDTMGIDLIRGRPLTPRDDVDAPRVVVINESMAGEFWPGQDPIGRRIRFGDPDDPWYTVVGLAADTSHYGLDSGDRPAAYASHLQKDWEWLSWMTLMVRTSSDPTVLADRVRSEVWALDPELAIEDLRPMSNIFATSIAQRRFSMLLLTMFSLVGLLLAAGGIYGVISYSVSQRTGEIGTRIALGARAVDIFRVVMEEGLALIAMGVGAGLIGALVLTRSLSTLLVGVGAADPFTYIAIVAFLSSVAMIACYIPARRATRVDPIVALRSE